MHWLLIMLAFDRSWLTRVSLQAIFGLKLQALI
jgi:hypothetical protein